MSVTRAGKGHKKSLAQLMRLVAVECTAVQCIQPFCDLSHNNKAPPCAPWNSKRQLAADSGALSNDRLHQQSTSRSSAGQQPCRRTAHRDGSLTRVTRHQPTSHFLRIVCHECSRATCRSQFWLSAPGNMFHVTHHSKASPRTVWIGVSTTCCLWRYILQAEAAKPGSAPISASDKKCYMQLLPLCTPTASYTRHCGTAAAQMADS